MSHPEHSNPDAELTKRAAEQEQARRDALRTVNLISRAAGKELPIHTASVEDMEAPGVYILDNRGLAANTIRDVQFDLKERLLSGASDSGHAVLAGELAALAGDGARTNLSIAAKCYRKRTPDERLERAKREVKISQDMEARHELALRPVAVAVASPTVAEAAVVLITEYDAGVYTMDNNPWGRGPTKVNIANAITAAEALGRFNNFGYQHGDAKIKNVAAKPGTRASMIDFETSTEIDLNDPSQAAEAAHVDLGLLLESLTTKGLFSSERHYSQPTMGVVEAVRRICDEYLSCWEDASPGSQAAVFDAVAEVAQGVIDANAPVPVDA